MRIPLTPQLLGDLIEKGYNYVLVSERSADDQESILFKPVRTKPRLEQLPEGFETFYRITREPMQMACGIEGVSVEIDYHINNPGVTGDDIFEDSYFRMSEDFFHLVLDSLDDYAVVTTDKNGDINSWNKGAEKLMGYAANEVIGCSAEIFFTPEDIAKGSPGVEMETAQTDGRALMNAIMCVRTVPDFGEQG